MFSPTDVRCLAPETVRQSVLWRASAASLVQFSSIITKSIHLASQEVPLRVFVAFARFCGQQDDLWIDFNTAKVARGAFWALQQIPSSFIPLTETLENLLKHCGKEGVEHAILSILKGYVRSCFSRSPHPSVSRTSGRKLPRPAESLSANSEEGAWKGKNGFEDAIGCWNVLAFCLDVMTVIYLYAYCLLPYTDVEPAKSIGEQLAPYNSPSDDAHGRSRSSFPHQRVERGSNITGTDRYLSTPAD